MAWAAAIFRGRDAPCRIHGYGAFSRCFVEVESHAPLIPARRESSIMGPHFGTNGQSVALDFSGTFFGRGYGLSIPNLITLARILAVP